MKYLPIFLILLTGCGVSAPFSESETRLQPENVKEVIIQRWGKTSDDKVRMHQSKSLTDENKIAQLINELNNATYSGQMDGTLWDRILLVGQNNDTTTIYTDGKLFGTKPSGTFYKLSTPDIYKEYWQIERNL